MKIKLPKIREKLQTFWGFLSLSVLFLGLAASVILVTQRQEIRKRAIEANTTHFSLVPDSTTLAVNETITSAVWLDSGDNGAVIVTSVINFDNDQLSVENISTTDVFATDISISSVTEANTNGIITIIQGLSAQQRDPVVGANKIAQIEFEAAVLTGSLSADNVSFDTSASKVANAQDPPGWMTITADGARYQVGEGVPPPPTPTPTPPSEECWHDGDFNCDGEVDLLDFELFRDIYVEHL